MQFDDLVWDVVNLIVSELDPPSRCTFSLTCKSHYERYFDRKQCAGNALIVDALRFGYLNIARFAFDELSCPVKPYRDLELYLSEPREFEVYDPWPWTIESLLELPKYYETIVSK